jgi:hypothetical protein
MVDLLIAVGVVVLLGLGFYFTRGAGGPPPLDAEGREVDTVSHVSLRGKPRDWNGEDAERPDLDPTRGQCERVIAPAPPHPSGLSAHH